MREKINPIFNQEKTVERPYTSDLEKAFEFSPQFNIEGLWFKVIKELKFFGDTIYYEATYNVKDTVENRKLLNKYKDFTNILYNQEEINEVIGK